MKNTLTPLILLALAGLASAQDANSDLERLRGENRVLRRELRALKTLVDGLAARAATGTPEASGLKVGVVNLGKLFQGYQRRAVLEQEINATRELMKARVSKKWEELERLEKEQAALPEGERARLAGELVLVKRAYDSLRSEMSGVLRKRVEDMTVELLGDIQKATQEFAAAEGYDMILKTDPERLAGGSETIYRAQVDAVVFHRDTLDVTASVLERLNGAAPKRGLYETPVEAVFGTLADAGASFRATQKGDALEVQLVMPAHTRTDLSAVARLRDRLRRDPLVGRACEDVLVAGPIVVTAEERIECTFSFRKWTVGRPFMARVVSLDRELLERSGGPIAKLVRGLRAPGRRLEGWVVGASFLYLSLRGSERPLAPTLLSGRLDSVGKLASWRAGSEGVRHRALAIVALKTSTAYVVRHDPVEDLRVEPTLGGVYVEWTLPQTNDYVMVTQLSVERYEQGRWQSALIVPAELDGPTFLPLTSPTRLRVVSHAEVDRESPLVRRNGLELPEDERQRASAITPEVGPLPSIYVVPVDVPEQGPGRFRVHLYDAETNAFLEPREFTVARGRAIGEVVRVGRTEIDYRTKLVYISGRAKGRGVRVATLRDAAGKEREVSNEDEIPTPRADLPKRLKQR